MAIQMFFTYRSEEHTSDLQSPCNIVCRLLLEKKNTQGIRPKLFRALPHLRSRPHAQCDAVLCAWCLSRKDRGQKIFCARGDLLLFFFKETCPPGHFPSSPPPGLPD